MNLLETSVHTDAISSGTRKVQAGFFGRGIQSARTPFMHDAEGRRRGLDISHALIDLDETELLTAARNHGCHPLPASEMLMFQTEHAFELFNGLAADPDAMRARCHKFESGTAR